MCFIKSKGGKAIKAKENITCYKDVIYNINSSNYCLSFFQNFEYILGVEYRLSFFRRLIFRLKNSLKSRNQIYKGFHSYKNHFDNNAECIIPKGSYYFENEYEYVSTGIKIIKRC